MWDVRGWKSLTVHDDPPLVAAREEFLSWLSKVPQPHQASWKGRLVSGLDHPHYSVRLELYLHHYFESNSWDIDIEPNMFGSPNKPDFRVVRGEDRITVEAKAVLDAQADAQQTQILRQLADELTKKLSKTIIIEPLSDLPSSLPAKEIVRKIESHATTQTSEILEFDIDVKLQNIPYSLKIIVLPELSGESKLSGVQGMVSGVHTITTGTRIRDALEEKAGKYGYIEMPFLIAVYGKGEFPVRPENEIDALFGDREWLVPRKGDGQVTERRKPNGFFTSMRQDKRCHEHVSAVLFYRFKWLDNSHIHQTHIYHNPFALRLINPDFFPNVPQLVPTMKWINGEPEI